MRSTMMLGGYRRSGRSLTLIEVSIALGMLSVFMLLLISAMSQVKIQGALSETKSDLDLQANRALRSISVVLQGSGPMTHVYGAGNQLDYPLVYQGGLSTARSNHFDHAVPNDLAPAGFSPGYLGASDSVVFKHPTDLDGSNTPVDSEGLLEWGDVEYGFVVVPGPDGINQLEYRVANNSAGPVAGPTGVPGPVSFPAIAGNGTLTFVLARHVERMQIEQIGTLGTAKLRVTLYLVRRISANDYVRATRSTTVWLQNYDPDEYNPGGF